MTCMATKESEALPGHVHTCGADLGPQHSRDDDHFCTACGRWWWGS